MEASENTSNPVVDKTAPTEPPPPDPRDVGTKASVKAKGNTKSKRIFVRIEPFEHARLARVAKAQRRSVAQLVRNLIADGLEANNGSK